MAYNTMPVVLEEIIMQEILIRLPIKSLVQCRSVCKLWNSLFYNPDFLSNLNHRSISPNLNRDHDDYHIHMNSYNDDTHYGLSILSRKQLSETRMIDNYVPAYPLSLSRHYVHLVGSINGLVCMAFQYEDEHQFIIWNPTIRFSNKISVPKHSGFKFYSPFLYGFGWDSVTNDYKLIATPLSTHVISPAGVYSCKTNCWSNTKNLCRPSLDVNCKPPCVIINGSPYWNYYNILKFDITSNEFKYLNNLPSNCIFYSLINLNDCLALIDNGNWSDGVVVYSFDEEHNIWMKMYTIIDEGLDLEDMKVYCFKSGREIVFHENKNLHLYDPKSREIKSHRRFPNCRWCLVKSHKPNHHLFHDCGGRLVNGFTYTPSLVVLQGMKALHM